jgi:hypothetical protein
MKLAGITCDAKYGIPLFLNEWKRGYCLLKIFKIFLTVHIFGFRMTKFLQELA